MENFENTKINDLISQFENKNTDEFINYLFIKNPRLNEEQYKRIITMLQSGIETVDDDRSVIFNTLTDLDSNICKEFFKQILEDDNTKYLNEALLYFAESDLNKNMNYLEKVLLSRNDFENALVTLFNDIAHKYIGNPWINDRLDSDKEIGKAKLCLLLNNEKFAKKFDKNNLKLFYDYGGEDNFLANDNLVNPLSFLKETKMYKVHYQKTAV
jgi:hypothetical protein